MARFYIRSLLQGARLLCELATLSVCYILDYNGLITILLQHRSMLYVEFITKLGKTFREHSCNCFSILRQRCQNSTSDAYSCTKTGTG